MILLVRDNERNRDILSTLLERRGIKLEWLKIVLEGVYRPL